MSNARLRWLLWTAALIGCWTLLLDWRDDLEPVRREAHAAQAQRARELASMEGLDWIGEASRARDARIEWLSRFIEADTPGLMRVMALEHVKELCEEVQAGCTISLIGNDADTTAVASSAPLNASAAVLAGTRPIQVKVSFNFVPDALLRLLRGVEAGDKLTSVDRLLITGPRAELQLSVFGVEAGEGRKLRATMAAPKGDGS
ncbi:hypothetical protein QTI33_14440 [Variovorax sp. J22P271]|uniref:hypothetical protein n=1 Tax=Variovorax davisae TaxID=3053515 RepID=UPI0025753789|nr:hypothetical protein [Variovorax sp. J22P271]MDM0033330.1 hypothetical protein [Variovorax sp. J22P271]